MVVGNSESRWWEEVMVGESGGVGGDGGEVWWDEGSDGAEIMREGG